MSPQEIMKLSPDQMEAHASYLEGMTTEDRAAYKAAHGLKDVFGIDAITELVAIIRSEKNFKLNGPPDYKIVNQE